MSEEFDKRVDIEEDRAVAQEALRVAKKALIVTVDEDGGGCVRHFNLTSIEHRGLVELLRDTSPEFTLEADDEDE